MVSLSVQLTMLFDAEAALMEATEKMQEDERPDDGEVEIDSDEEYCD